MPDKISLTVAIPAVIPLEQTLAYLSFLQSAVQDRLFVQFVHLRNLPKLRPEDITPSSFTAHDTHEVIRITNDRYYSSCEENMFRIQDFIHALQPYVVFVGDHDAVDWENMADAAAHAHNNQLGALGLHIVSQQAKHDGSYSLQAAVPVLDETTPSNNFCRLLIEGEILPSDIGWPAMVATYGAIDWVSYIGSHMFHRETLLRMMQYNFSDYIYAIIHKMARYFTEAPVRYGFFNQPVIRRIGEEFVKSGSTDHTLGWLGEHRAVHGQSPNPWLPNLHYLEQLPDEKLFNVIVSSRCIACEFKPDGEQRYQHYTYLHHTFSWAERTFAHCLNGRSFYLPEQSPFSGMQDLRYIYLFFCKVLVHAERYPEHFAAFNDNAKNQLAEGMRQLELYIYEIHAPETAKLQLINARSHMTTARIALDIAQYPAMNQASFHDFVLPRISG